MLENKYKQITISEHISLYDKIIPQDHFLRKLKENIDFSFVNKLVAKEYSEQLGRPAKEPEMMYKLLFLQTKDLLSDREVIERAKTDMAYKFFLDLNPEDDVPSYSLLSVFRNTKIKDENILEEMLKETVKQAIKKGIVKSNSIIVDAAHTNSKTHRKSSTQILRELSKKLRKEIYISEPEIKDVFPNKPEETSTLEEEIEYTKKLVEAIRGKITEKTNKKIIKKLEKVESMLTDDKIKRIQSSVDEDARQGYKTPKDSFFGYKNHVAITKERIVTALEVTSGEVSDGKYLPVLVKKTERAGIEVKEVIGDKAYSGKDNLEYGEKENIKIIARMASVIANGRRKGDNGFEYIKDADTIRCPMGELAKYKYHKKAAIGKRKGSRGIFHNERMHYEFDKNTCNNCPKKKECLGENKKRGKTYSITILSNIHKKQIEFEKTEYFDKTIKNERYKIEAQNAETKIIHGLSTAKSVGLSRMRVQSYLAHITTNIKRTINKMDEVPT